MFTVQEFQRPYSGSCITILPGFDSSIHSDEWRVYNWLVDLVYAKHLRVDHGQNEFITWTRHINGDEGFWGFV